MEKQLEPAVYWKLKAKYLELMVAEQQIATQKARALREAGLEPDQNYTMNDETTTVSTKENT